MVLFYFDYVFLLCVVILF